MTVKVRFCPSPTGTPHVGMVRTALFNWGYARHTGGKLVFRIEDTDAARDSEESYQAIIDSLTWLGMDWDEGVVTGGPNGPYRQSQRMDIYRDVLEKLTEAGYVYPAYSTNEEVQQRHREKGEDPQLGYDNFDRTLTPKQRAEFEAQGRTPVWRFRMPEKDWTWTDLVRGEITFAQETQPDFVVARSDGSPLYTLVNPIDDAMMGINVVLRGEDILPSTPRQMALYEALIALGIAEGTPEFGHLPFVMGTGNKKLSKRDPESNLFNHRDAGIIPEGMLNYLALLGWSMKGDSNSEIFSVDEFIAAFDVHDVLGNPARFDQKKLEAINADHIRLLEPADFEARLKTYLADYFNFTLADADFTLAASLVQTRIKTLSEAYGLLKFLEPGELTYDEKSVQKNLATAEAGEYLRRAQAALETVSANEWVTAAIESALQAALGEDKPRKFYGAVRVAVTGAAVSPPLFESMQLLGRERTMARIDHSLSELVA